MTEPGLHHPPDETMLDLLVKQVTEGLSRDEERVLDVLDSATASTYARDLERAAAALALAGTGAGEPLPAALRARLEEAARLHVAPAPPAPVLEGARGPAPPARRPRRPERGAAAGWWAAAACLLLALLGWLRPHGERIAPAAPSALLAQRAALLARPDTLKLVLGPTQEPAAAGMSADVVWNPATQQGFLRFAGLKPNDPKVQQYQLWIFDAERDSRYPIDGGVFDIPAHAGEVLVPIRAALPVHLAKAFAVTVEKPGGVVVSAREHVVALGAAG